MPRQQPNGTVAMEFAQCETCSGTFSMDRPAGITCGCGHHFHVGRDLIIGTSSLSCPRCEGTCFPLDLGETTQPGGDQ